MNHMGTPGPDPKVSDAELVEAAQEIGDPCFTAKEIRGKVNLDSNVQVRDRLNKLVERGVFGTKNSGSGNVYWLD